MTEQKANMARVEAMKQSMEGLAAKDRTVSESIGGLITKTACVPNGTNGKEYTIDRLWELYKSLVLDVKSRWAVDSRIYKANIGPAFGHKRPEEITTEDVDAFRDSSIKQGLNPSTVQQRMALLRRIINFGVKRGYIEKPRYLFFNMPHVDNQKTEFLDDAQLKRYIDVLNSIEKKKPVLVAFLRILMYTGMRPGALYALRWEDCDFKAGIITLQGEHAKSGRTDHIAMCEGARDALLSLSPKAEGWIFPSDKGKCGHIMYFDRSARKINKAAGLPKDFRALYFLRHNFASRLASSGKVDIYTLQRALTHRTIAMTQRYAHLTDEAARRVAAVADEVMSVGTKEMEEDPK